MTVDWTWFHKLGSPPSFFRFAEVLAPWLFGAAALCIGVGFYSGLFLAPADYQQGDAFRIIYAHVPAAAVSLSIYVAMAIAGAVALIWRMKLAEVAVVAAAPIGASFTVVALATGMLWGKPMWGAYWVWQDARLVSELILLFFYLGIVALNSAFADARAGARACAWLALIGVINVPVVKYSVEWWNTLHQGSSLLSVEGMRNPKISGDMLWPLLLSLLGFYLLFGAAWLRRMQVGIVWRERRAEWVRDFFLQVPSAAAPDTRPDLAGPGPHREPGSRQGSPNGGPAR
jgi:heme exporter protein C